MPSHTARQLSLSATWVAVLAVLLVPGSGPWSGPVLLTLTRTHGVHASDLVVVALGLAVLLAAVRAAPQRRVALPTTAAAGSATWPSAVRYAAVASAT